MPENSSQKPAEKSLETPPDLGAIESAKIPGIYIERLEGKKPNVRVDLQKLFGITAEQENNENSLKDAVNAFNRRIQKMPDSQLSPEQRDAIKTMVMRIANKKLKEMSSVLAPKKQPAPVAPALTQPSSAGTIKEKKLVTPSQALSKRKGIKGAWALLYGGIAAGAALVASGTAGVVGWKVMKGAEEQKGKVDDAPSVLIAKNEQVPPQSGEEKISSALPQQNKILPVQSPMNNGADSVPMPEHSDEMPMEVTPLPSPPPALPENPPEKTPMNVQPPLPKNPSVKNVQVKTEMQKINELQAQVKNAGYLTQKLHADFLVGKSIYAPNLIQPPRWKTSTVRISREMKNYSDGMHADICLPIPQTMGNQIVLGSKAGVQIGNKTLDSTEYSSELMFLNPADEENPYGTYFLRFKIAAATLAAHRQSKQAGTSFILHADTAMLFPEYPSDTASVKQRELITKKWASSIKQPLPPYEIGENLVKLPPTTQALFKKTQGMTTPFERLMAGYDSACALKYSAKNTNLETLDALTTDAGDCGVKAIKALEIAKVREAFFVAGFAAHLSGQKEGGHTFIVAVMGEKGKERSFVMDPLGVNNGYIGPQYLGTTPGKGAFVHLGTNVGTTTLGALNNNKKRSSLNAGLWFDNSTNDNRGWPAISVDGLHGKFAKNMPRLQTVPEIIALAGKMEETHHKLYKR